MKYKIGVCGGRNATPNTLKQAKLLGALIAKKKFVLLTGATVGVAKAAAEGAKENFGEVIGFSPAKNEKEHLQLYDFPLELYDVINYTGVGKMRNWIFVRSCDAIIAVGGGIGTLNEITIAVDEGILTSALIDTDGIADHSTKIMEMCNLPKNLIITETNPTVLLEKLENSLSKKR